MSRLLRPVHRLRYFCSDAWEEWRHSLGVNLTALITLATSLFVAGLVILVVANVSREVGRLQEEIRVDVYLDDDHTESDRTALVEQLSSLGGVERVDYVDKAQALDRYRQFAGEIAGLVDELEDNPLPASIEVYLEPGEQAVPLARRIAGKARTSAAVEEVRFNGEWLERLEGVLRVVRLVGTGLAGVVLAATILVMASVLRLAVYQRREEIEIMLLVGAKPSFIRGPFLVTGIVQGLFASAFALGAVELMRYLLVARAGPATLAVIGLLAARPLTPLLTAVVVLVGLAVSLTGSYFAVRPSY